MKVISSLGPKIELLPYPLTKLPNRATGYNQTARSPAYITTDKMVGPEGLEPPTKRL